MEILLVTVTVSVMKWETVSVMIWETVSVVVKVWVDTEPVWLCHFGVNAGGDELGGNPLDCPRDLAARASKRMEAIMIAWIQNERARWRSNCSRAMKEERREEEDGDATNFVVGEGIWRLGNYWSKHYSYPVAGGYTVPSKGINLWDEKGRHLQMHCPHLSAPVTENARHLGVLFLLQPSSQDRKTMQENASSNPDTSLWLGI